MLIPSIKDIIALPDGTALRAMRGRVKAAGEYKTGQAPGTNETMTVQEIFLEDEEDGISVKVGNHPDLIGLVGKVVVFLATPKAKGGFAGLKRSTDQKPGTEIYPCIRLSKGATIQEAAAFEAANPAAAPIPTAPVAQAAPAPVTPVVPVPAPVVPVATPVQPSKALAPEPRICQVDAHAAQIKTVTYGRTVNTGNFCSERMDITVELGNRVDVDAVVAEIKDKLTQHLPPEFIPPTGRPVK